MGTRQVTTYFAIAINCIFLGIAPVLLGTMLSSEKFINLVTNKFFVKIKSKILSIYWTYWNIFPKYGILIVDVVRVVGFISCILSMLAVVGNMISKNIIKISMCFYFTCSLLATAFMTIFWFYSIWKEALKDVLKQKCKSGLIQMHVFGKNACSIDIIENNQNQYYIKQNLRHCDGIEEYASCTTQISLLEIAIVIILIVLVFFNLCFLVKICSKKYNKSSNTAETQTLLA